MDCEVVDWVMFGLVIVLIVAVVAMYVFIIPSYAIAVGMAAQCVVDNPCGKFAMFMVSMLMSFFMGYTVARLTEKDNNDEEEVNDE